MRIIVGGMGHESNTLNPIITGADDFVVFRGPEMLSKGLLPYYSITGIVEELRLRGCRLVPTLVARAVPNGIVCATFYRDIKAEFVRRIRDALAEGRVDGVCLALHGSMKVEGLGCAEEDLAAALRELLPDVPIVAALDMHGTMTPRLLSLIDGFVAYKTAPHIDCLQTGAHAARMLVQSIEAGTRPHTVCRRVPMIVAGEKSESDAEPMASLLSRCRLAETADGVLAASLLLGFPWADDRHTSVSVLVTTLGDAPTGKTVAESIAREFWARRRDFAFRVEHHDSRTAIDLAYKAVLDEGQSPVFVSDSGDNPTAGATGDATELLEKILDTMDTVDRLPTRLLYSGFFDAKATGECMDVGVGTELDITVGGNWDTANGRRIPLRVRVESVVENYGTFCSNIAAVSVGNLLIVLTSKHIGFGDEELLPALGIRAEDHCLVVVKLGYLEPCFREIAARAILATSRGCSNEILESIPY
ncbi:MAG: M81 family metallopeptidase, partial [Treponema sp.]|nr:M81 family metallopeptidase [Treponema sp.]